MRRPGRNHRRGGCAAPLRGTPSAPGDPAEPRHRRGPDPERPPGPELLWSSALHSADRAALTPAAKGAEAAKVETAKVKSFHELFCVITRIGEGATGTVILAKDRASEQRRAVKVVHKTPGGQELKEENRS
ncbi:unnamed protein product [Durusdinium trenchii]|uniref:Protein kinase domain-containing protein n=1 Tax=Durusdinium trenchii TaxID=1381693 RepID=A0ABP0RC53_9DINO